MPSPPEPVATKSPAKPRALRPGSTPRRWLPLAVLGFLVVLVFTMGWHELLSLKTVGTNYDSLRQVTAINLLAALALYIAIYIAVVALSLPAAGILTITGGLLFGWHLGAPAATAFSIAGAGLGGVVEAQNAAYKACRAKNQPDPPTACTYTIDTSALITGELLIALAVLGTIALFPIAAKCWKARQAAS